ncbi:hypothetical protein T492DRAFT_160761 [Pavlovales sp. CCMP2436]|nr:hypothetical protein T492DRAFT_160761 [Pavlovales sp. CCMP2436]
MLADLATSADCVVGPSGVNPLRALANAVDGSVPHGFDLAGAFGGGSSSLLLGRDGAGASAHGAAAGPSVAFEQAQHETFARHFAGAGKQPMHPALERAWVQNALRQPSGAAETAWAHAAAAQPSGAAEAAWAHAAVAQPMPLQPMPLLQHHALAPLRALPAADANPAVTECFRALVHADESVPQGHLRALASAMSRSLPPDERERVAARAGTLVRLALGERADSGAGTERLRMLSEELGAPALLRGMPSMASVDELAQAGGWANEFAAGRAGGGVALHAGPVHPGLLAAGPGLGGGGQGLAGSFWAARAVRATEGGAEAAQPDSLAAAAAAHQDAQASHRLRSEGGGSVQQQPAAQQAGPADSEARDVAGSMIEALEANAADDARFGSSQLLQWLRGVHDGSVELGGDEGAVLAAAEQAGQASAAAEGGSARAMAAAAERAWTDALTGDVADASLFEGLWDNLGLDGSSSAKPAGGVAQRGAAERFGPAAAEAEARGAGAQLGGMPGEVERALAAALDSLDRARGEPVTERAPPPYEFQSANPFAGRSPLEALAAARALHVAGRLSEAVLAAEAAAQQTPADSTAWQLLGQLHADSDDDAAAIVALRHAVAADPANGAARLLLGVSCTNELDQPMALHHLRQWLRTHPNARLAALAAEADAAGGMQGGQGGGWERSDPFAAHERLASLFQRAVAEAAEAEEADVQAVQSYKLINSQTNSVGCPLQPLARLRRGRPRLRARAAAPAGRLLALEQARRHAC